MLGSYLIVIAEFYILFEVMQIRTFNKLEDQGTSTTSSLNNDQSLTHVGRCVGGTHAGCIERRGDDLMFGAETVAMICPHCNHLIQTDVKHMPSSRTHLVAAVLCLMLCWLCIPCPYCIGACQDAYHYCPDCKAYLGKHNIRED